MGLSVWLWPLVLLLWLCLEQQPHFNERMVVVIPWTDKDLPTLRRNLRSWAKYPPGYSGCDLVFWHHAHEPAEKVQLELRQLAGPQWRHVHFANAQLSEDGYPLGASMQFFRLLEQPWLFEYSWLLLFEPDCWPCRPGWLEAIQQQAKKHPQGWMMGSITRPHWNGNTGTAHADHLNGNALYRLNDVGFMAYLERVREEFWRHPRRYLQSYDVAIHLVGKSQLPWEEYSAMKHRFVYWETMQNYYRAPVNATELCRRHADTYLVHGRRVNF